MSRAYPFTRQPAAAESDGELIQALHGSARRSVLALKRIYDLTAPRLLGELVQLLGDPQAAETALAECYIQIWQQAGMYNPERCRPGTWLMSIARHHAIDSLREQPSAPEEVDAALRLMDAVLTEEEPAVELRMLKLAQASGRSPAEIARALQWPAQRVRASIRQGLMALAGSEAVNLQGQALQQLAGGYALGTFSARVSRRFEAMLARDVAARRAWQQWEERLSGIARETPPVRPLEKTWQAIESRLEQKAPARARLPRIWWLVIALLLSVALVLFRARLVRP